MVHRQFEDSHPHLPTRFVSPCVLFSMTVFLPFSPTTHTANSSTDPSSRNRHGSGSLYRLSNFNVADNSESVPRLDLRMNQRSIAQAVPVTCLVVLAFCSFPHLILPMFSLSNPIQLKTLRHLSNAYDSAVVTNSCVYSKLLLLPPLIFVSLADGTQTHGSIPMYVAQLPPCSRIS